MNQNPTVDNDLQKAIDDITKNTNSDPVFADPVAAPAPVPQNSAKPTPPRAPAPRPRPSRQAPMMPPAPRPAAPSMSRMNGMPPMPPAPKMSAPAISEPPMPAPRRANQEQPLMEEENMTSPIDTEITNMPDPAEFTGNSDISELKEDILRSLLPEMDNISLSPSEKFDIYRSAIDDLHDSSVIGSALNTAKNIADDQERGEALLHLFDVVKGL